MAPLSRASRLPGSGAWPWAWSARLFRSRSGRCTVLLLLHTAALLQLRLPLSFCGSLAPRARKGFPLRAGYMFFNLDGIIPNFAQEGFVIDTMQDLYKDLPYLPSGATALEWQPGDGKGIKFMTPQPEGCLKKYFALECTKSAEFLKNSAGGADWPVKIVGLGQVPKETVDIALCRFEELESMTPPMKQQCILDSARSLRKKGFLMVFLSSEGQDRFLQQASTHFDLVKIIGDGENSCLQLSPKLDLPVRKPRKLDLPVGKPGASKSKTGASVSSSRSSRSKKRRR